MWVEKVVKMIMSSSDRLRVKAVETQVIRIPIISNCHQALDDDERVFILENFQTAKHSLKTLENSCFQNFSSL